jgi:hypothetical protein
VYPGPSAAQLANVCSTMRRGGMGGFPTIRHARRRGRRNPLPHRVFATSARMSRTRDGTHVRVDAHAYGWYCSAHR